jgi:hypothetical protein
MSSAGWPRAQCGNNRRGFVEPSSDKDDDSNGDFASRDSEYTWLNYTWLDVTVVTLITLTIDAGA